MHAKYSPVGYGYQSDNYCLDCITSVTDPTAGRVPRECNCTECALDRIAESRGIDRYNEASFDMDTFPKAIPYHNDLHSECEMGDYGWSCYDTCAECGDPIDYVYSADADSFVCPGYASYLNNMEA